MWAEILDLNDVCARVCVCERMEVCMCAAADRLFTPGEHPFSHPVSQRRLLAWVITKPAEDATTQNSGEHLSPTYQHSFHYKGEVLPLPNSVGACLKQLGFLISMVKF